VKESSRIENLNPIENHLNHSSGRYVIVNSRWESQLIKAHTTGNDPIRTEHLRNAALRPKPALDTRNHMGTVFAFLLLLSIGFCFLSKVRIFLLLLYNDLFSLSTLRGEGFPITYNSITGKGQFGRYVIDNSRFGL